MVKLWKKNLFICANLPTEHRKSTLHNAFYFNTHQQKNISDLIPQTCNLTKLNATFKDPLKRMACKNAEYSCRDRIKYFLKLSSS